MKKIKYLIVLVLMVLAGCSVAKRPAIDRNPPEHRMLLEHIYKRLYEQQHPQKREKEAAAEVEHRKYLQESKQ